MNNSSMAITWGDFKSILETHPDLHLQFEYAEGAFVDKSFHITEIKQALITSVDCGGQLNSWTEIVVQLWEPAVQESARSMQVSKALQIVHLVEKSLPLDPNATVKIEFGNSKFHTRQMYPGSFVVGDEDLTVNLVPDYTQCKALSRNQSCGTTTPEAACCTPAPVAVEVIEVEQTRCQPGSGCC